MLDCSRYLSTRFPPTNGVRWFNVAILTLTPVLSVHGLLTRQCNRNTGLFSVAYYVFTMLGITAGYHRLWSHRSYNASRSLQLFLIAGGSSAVQGSCYWWARTHRSHHRYTDTDLDPYDSKRGLFWTHIGWMVFKSTLRSGPADASDLKKDSLIQFQHRHYFLLAAIFGVICPVIIPGMFWGDWAGGLYFSAILRLTIAHHSTFCINSLAHWLGSSPYDDQLSPRDHFFSAILTMGEGYHNFHHQFPMDYRNAFYWYQYDPTKWFIALCELLGQASHLRAFPENEIKKGIYTMKLKELKTMKDSIEWPSPSEALPMITWGQLQEQSQGRVLILVSGFIHDMTTFVDHPGGRGYLLNSSGKDMSASFFGGVYRHSNAAHNLLAMYRVGILHGGMETISDPERVTRPSERLAIVPVQGKMKNQ